MEFDQKNPEEVKPQSRKTSTKSPGVVILSMLLTIIIAVVLGAVVYFYAVDWIPFLGNGLFQSNNEDESLLVEIQDTQKALENNIYDISATLDVYEQSGYQTSINKLETDIQNLADTLSTAQRTVDINSQMNTYMATVYPQMLFDFEEELAANSRNLGALATAQMGSSDIEGDLALIRILEQLSFINQFLLHSNYGLAEDTLKIAKDDLLKLQQSSLGFQKEYILSIIDLVDGAISDLPTKPKLAADKVELAWQLGLNGLPKLGNTDLNITRTPTPYSPGFTPSPTAP